MFPRWSTSTAIEPRVVNATDDHGSSRTIVTNGAAIAATMLASD